MIYIGDETYHDFSSYIYFNVYCNNVNFDNYKSPLRIYKYNIYLEVLKKLSPLYKYGDEEFYNKSMNVYIDGIDLKHKLDKIKLELDNIFVYKITDLYNLRYHNIFNSHERIYI